MPTSRSNSSPPISATPAFPPSRTRSGRSPAGPRPSFRRRNERNLSQRGFAVTPGPSPGGTAKPRCDRFRSFLLRKLGRGPAGDLPERVREGGNAGVAEIGGELFDRDVGIDRQSFDRRGDARALAPALEAQFRLRGEQP